MGDTLYGDGDSFENNIQEAFKEQIPRTTESDSKDVTRISSDEDIKEQDADLSLMKDNLVEEQGEKEKENHETIKEAKNIESASQMCSETTGDDLHADDASIYKNMQESCVVADKEQICTIIEDESIEVMAISTNEHKKEQDTQKGLPNEELTDERQEKEEEETTNQEAKYFNMGSQMNIERTGDILYANDALSDKNMQKAPVVVFEEQIQSMQEDEHMEERANSINENREMQYIHRSLQKEELEDGQQEEKSKVELIDEKDRLEHEASVIISEESFNSMPAYGSAEGREISKNQNKEKHNIQKSSQNEEVKDGAKVKEEIKDIDEEDKDSESVSQVNIDKISVTLHASDASFDKYVQDGHSIGVEVKEISKNENKEELCINKGLQKAELEDGPQEKEEIIKANDEEGKHDEVAPEISMETMDDILHADNANNSLFEENIQESTVVVANKKVHDMPEDDIKDAGAISKNTYMEDHDVHASLPEEELKFESQENEKDINATDKEAKDVMYQMNMEKDTSLFTNIASSSENMEKASIVDVKEQIQNIREDDGIEEKAIPENESREEQDINTSQTKEEPEHELNEKEEETNSTGEEVSSDNRNMKVKNDVRPSQVGSEEQIHGMPEDDRIENEQKSFEISNMTMINENDIFKEKESIEYGSKKEKLENQETNFPDIVLAEVETKNKSTAENDEENVWKDMTSVESVLEPEHDNQNSKLVCTTKRTISQEEISKETSLIQGVTKVDADNEVSHQEIVSQLSVTQDLAHGSRQLEKDTTELEPHERPKQSGINIKQNEEKTERSEALSVNTSIDRQDMGDETKNSEKDFVYKEDAPEVTNQQSKEDETEARTSNEPAVDTVLSRQDKEHVYQSPKYSITSTYSPEDPGTSSVMAPLSEETAEKVGEKFSKISDYWPRQDAEEASNVHATNVKHSKEAEEIVEAQTEAEKPIPTSPHLTSTYERDVNDEEVLFLGKASGLDAICEEAEKLKEVPDLVAKEKADVNNSSSNEPTKNKNLKETSEMQEPEVKQPEVILEAKEMATKACHDNGEVEFSNLQYEEKKQMPLDDLPVSQFLMKHILQEQGDVLNEACNDEYEDMKNKKNEEGKQITRPEEASLPMFTVQATKEAGSAEDKAGSDNLENNSASVQEEQGNDLNQNSKFPTAKEDESLQCSLDDSTSRLMVAAGDNDEVGALVSEVLTDVASKERMELKPTDLSKVDNEECRHAESVEHEKARVGVLEENLAEKEDQKDDENMDKYAVNSYFSKASQQEFSQKGAQRSKEFQKEIERLEASCAESEEQSTMSGQKLEVWEVKSEATKLETEEKQNGENQVRLVKNDTDEELKLSELQESQQTSVAIDFDVHSQQIAQEVLEGNDSRISLDEKHMEETTNSKVNKDKTYEKCEREDEDERTLNQSGINATTAAEAEDAELKQIVRSNKTSESSKPSPVNHNKPREALEIMSAVKEFQREEEKQEETDRNEMQILKVCLTEELKPSESQKLQESDVVDEPAMQRLNTSEKISDKEHTVQTTDDKEDEEKTDDESGEKEGEDAHKAKELGHNTTITAENRDVELKPPQKKSHGILSGVGSKVKHSIAKVKKAIKGKSSPSKALSAK